MGFANDYGEMYVCTFDLTDEMEERGRDVHGVLARREN